MTGLLADGNVLVALTVVDHVHHDTAIRWFDQTSALLATCPITEGTLIRFLMREGASATRAMTVIDTIREQAWHEFWPDDLEYSLEHLRGVTGHRQVTDAYLVALARRRQSRIVTLDRGMASLHGDAVLLLESQA